MVAWAGSWRATDGIHAIELGDGKLLTTHSVSQELRPDVWSYEATFDGRPVVCELSHVTSSYWPRGVTIADGELAAAAQVDGSVTGGWRTLFLGRSEDFVVRAGFGFAGFVSLLAALVGLGLSLSIVRRRINGILVGVMLFVPLAAVAALVVSFAILTFGYAD